MSAFADRVLGPFRGLIRTATARVDYFALYSAVVNTDNGDETCDLTPEDTRLPSMSKIPKLYGLPGVTSTLSQGAKVLLCFQDGDPSKPAIVLFGSGAPSKLAIAPSTELDLAGSSGAAVGRVGDSVKVTIPVSSLLISTTGTAAAQTGTNTSALDVTGTITAGSSKVKAS